MKKVFDLDFGDYEFKCAECGNCCFRAVIPIPIGLNRNGFSHNFRGELVKNPKTTVAFFYTEKPRMEKLIRSRFKIEPVFYPQVTIYLEDYPVGFVLVWQIGTKKKSCMFYDRKTRRCKIYTVRPLSCQTYPLMLNLMRDTTPELAIDCTAVEDEMKRRVLGLSDEDQVEFKVQNPNVKEVMIKAFPNQYQIYLRRSIPNIRKTKLLIAKTRGLCIHPDEITPERIKGYKLLDASKFFAWARKNLGDSLDVDDLQKQTKNVEK